MAKKIAVQKILQEGLLNQLKELSKDMAWATKQIEALPDDTEMTMADEDVLEEVRHDAIKLTREIEAIFEVRHEAKSRKKT
jgi:hypothetical protein